MNFKIIEDYPKYKVTSCGKIFKNGREMKPNTNAIGYQRIGLYATINEKIFQVHRIVAKAFIDNPDNLPEVDHINRIRNDNRVENLRWVTHRDNMQNQGNSKNNTSGHKNISFNNKNNRWSFAKQIDGKTYRKSSPDLNEVLEYKAKFLSKLTYDNQVNDVEAWIKDNEKKILPPSGHKNIYLDKPNKCYKFEKMVDGKKWKKRSKDINELIKYKEELFKKFGVNS